jgi:hypothetical protein
VPHARQLNDVEVPGDISHDSHVFDEAQPVDQTSVSSSVVLLGCKNLGTDQISGAAGSNVGVFFVLERLSYDCKV